MKRITTIVLAALLLLSSTIAPLASAEETTFRGLSDKSLCDYISDEVYYSLLENIDSDLYAVTNVQSVYISQEYLDELEYNSQMNVFFGYSISELDEAFEGTRYVFTLGDDGHTTVKAFEGYDDTYERVLRNVAIGTGVILVCVTVSAVTGGLGAPAVSMIFAVAAKSGASAALSGAVLGGVSAGIVTGIRTGNMDEAVKAAALGGSEGFKWGAISGAITGAAKEGIGLYKATLAPESSLTMNDVAIIQKETKLSLNTISYIHSMDEYALYKNAGLTTIKVNGSEALIQSIDFDLIDEYGRTNVERIRQGLAPIDSSGYSFELHHVGQAQNSPLAILTQAQHRGTGNFSTLHFNTGAAESMIEREIFAEQKAAFWKAILELYYGA